MAKWDQGDWFHQLHRAVYPIPQYKKRFRDNYRLSKLERLNAQVCNKILLSDRIVERIKPAVGRLRHLTKQIKHLQVYLGKEVEKYEHDTQPTPAA